MIGTWLSRVPHSAQNGAPATLSCWQVGQCIIELRVKSAKFKVARWLSATLNFALLTLNLLSVLLELHQHRCDIVIPTRRISGGDQRGAGGLRIVVGGNDLGHLWVVRHLPLAIAAQEQCIAG